MQSKIRLSGITKESVVDGLGIRYVLYAQGCPHHCKGCHNPGTHSFEGGEMVDIESVLADIMQHSMLDGVTFSGGECFEKAEQFAYIAKSVKALGLNVWAYTGYTLEEILQHRDGREGWQELIKHIDILVDGKYEQDSKDLTLCFRGSANQRIIDMQKSLQTGKLSLINI